MHVFPPRVTIWEARLGSDALPTLAGLLIKVMQQTCPRILADYLRTAEPQTPSDLRKRADSDVEAGNSWLASRSPAEQEVGQVQFSTP
jgi:hypothetical protein